MSHAAKDELFLTGANWRWLGRFVRHLRLLFFRWKYRHIEEDLCCCGCMMSEAQPYDSICAHGGCRSAKEYAITCAMDKPNT